MRSIRAVAALLLVASSLGAARGVAAATIADAAQFPPLTGRVVDLAGVLSADTEADVAAQLAAWERQSGNQIVVATLTSLAGADVETYGYQLARHWQLGDAERDDGVLFFVVPSERVVRIEVGYGLEGELTDALTATIIQTRVLPAFRDGDYDRGVRTGVAAIIEVLSGDYAPQQTERRRLALPIGLFWIALVLVLLAAFGGRPGRRIARAAAWGVVLGGMGGGRGGGFGGGGGFRGGGGSFGGGGATGRW